MLQRFTRINLAPNEEKEVTLTASMMKDNVGYTPYEGIAVTGWPVSGS